MVDKFEKMNWIVFNIKIVMIVGANYVGAELNPDGEHVCLKTESFEETVFVENDVPKVITEVDWCWNVKEGFRCPKKKVISKRIKEPRVVNRTRFILECCSGYEEDSTDNTKCLPICPEPCLNGECTAPNTCSCDSGFHGPTCQKHCPPGRWGRNCIENCDCLNGAQCGGVNGNCICQRGWHGYRCELPCPYGYFGLHCKDRCDCHNKPCEPTTGDCIPLTTERIRPEPPQNETTTTDEQIDEHRIESSAPEKELTSTEGPITEITNAQTESVTEDATPETETMSETIAEKFQEMTQQNIPSAYGTTTSEDENDTAESIVHTDLLNSISGRAMERWTTNQNNFNETSTESGSGSAEDDNLHFEVTDEPFNISIINRTEEYSGHPISTTSDDYSGTSTMTHNGRGDECNDEESATQKTDNTLRFLPSMTVVSGVSILIIIIGIRWILLKHRKNIKQISGAKADDIFCSRERHHKYRESLFIVNNFPENPVYLTELNMKKETPVLQTFKPLELTSSESRQKEPDTTGTIWR